MVRRSADPSPPRDSSPDLPPVLDPLGRLRRGDDVLGVRISGLSGEIDASHAHLTETLWEAPALDRLDLTGTTLSETRIDEPRITALTGREARWRNVEIVGGRIGSVDLLRAELDGVVLRGTRVDYLALPSAALAHVRFVGCTFGSIDLPEARVDRVAFEDCRADEVDTRGLRAAHLDLRGLEALTYTDPVALRGATLTFGQAEALGAAFATALGISVRG